MKRIIGVCVLICSLTLTVNNLQASSSGLTTVGDVSQILLPLVAGIHATTKDDPLSFLKPFGATLATTYGLKYTLDTERPNGGSHSMPSGHTAAAFSGAAYIHDNLGWKWGLPAYTLAAVTAYSRVEGDFHHAEDCIVGALIAIGFNYWLGGDTKEQDSNQFARYLGQAGAERVTLSSLYVPVEQGNPFFGAMLTVRF